MIKMKCNCKGEFKEQIQIFEELECEALVCQKCGYVTLTRKHAEKLMKLKHLREMFHKERKIIKIGNAMGVTLPKEFAQKEGQAVTMVPLDEHTIKLKIG